MYCDPNYKTKKALREAVASGILVSAYSPGPFPCPSNGRVTIEGPHYPEPHRWYALVEVKDGQIIKIIK